MSSKYNRSPREIIALLELTIDSCFEIAKVDDNIPPKEKAIIDKLSEWKLKLEPQILHTLQAPMDEKDFRDILHQFLQPVIDSVVEQAKIDGVITPKEQKLIDNIIEKLKMEPRS